MLPEPVAGSTASPRDAEHRWLRATLPVLAILAAANLIGPLLLAHDRGGDFAMLYESTVRWLDGQPAYVSSQATTNLNHPLVWLLIAPLTTMPVDTAFAVWSLVSLLVFCGTVVSVCRAVGPPVTAPEVLVLVLALTGAGFELGLGQIALVLAAPFSLAWWYARTSRPVHAGVCLGLLCAMKPFFGLYAVWYMARRDWRALTALLASAAVTFATGLEMAGVANAQRWLLNLGNVTWTWHVFNASVFGVAARVFGKQDLAIAASWTPLAVSSVAAACAGWGGALAVLGLLVRRLRTADHDRSFALLGLAALLVSPLGWNYYLPTLFAPVLASLRQQALPRWSAVVAVIAVCPYAAVVNRHYGVVGTLLVGQIAFATVLGLFLLVASTSGSRRAGEVRR